MPKLREIARVIRSKNAGPFYITFDILFDNPMAYESAKRSGIINGELICKLYRVPTSEIEVIEYDPAYAIKITVVRPTPSGGLNDTDMFGAQQHAPLLGLEIPGGSRYGEKSAH